MNKFLKGIIVVVLLGLSISFVIIGNGYKLYQSALEEMTIQEKVEKIKQKENYTKIDEVPQMYIDAVISVEDHRFYQHKGIDFIAIGRAFINDIKAMSFVEGRKHHYTAVS